VARGDNERSFTENPSPALLIHKSRSRIRTGEAADNQQNHAERVCNLKQADVSPQPQGENQRIPNYHRRNTANDSGEYDGYN
jgi:hypothetical protein